MQNPHDTIRHPHLSHFHLLLVKSPRSLSSYMASSTTRRTRVMSWHRLRLVPYRPFQYL